MSREDRTLRVTRAGTPPRLRLRTCRLVLVEGAGSGRTVPLDGRVLHIGSAPDNDLVLDDPAISRHHAILEDTEEGFRLRDLGSTNGTWVNGVRTDGAFLDGGVTFRMGETCLRFEHSQENWAVDPWPDERFHGMVGRSPSMKYLFGFLHRMAATELSMLLHGETGTGKEVTARAIHSASARAGGPFVVFDGASTQPDLVAAALFGQRKGAFTGATRSRAGCFQTAHRGTLFLDEVAEIPLEVQPMLLRSLERREVQPLGTDQAVRVDVRIVAATHRDLEAMVGSGAFRQDLYHRLSGMVLELPRLSDRREDIPLLVQQVLDENPGMRVSARAVSALTARDWPGNVRELRQVLLRAEALAGGEEIELQHLTAGAVTFGKAVARSHEARPDGGPGSEALTSIEERERLAIVEALRATRGAIGLAADILGIARQTLRRKMIRHGIQRPAGSDDSEPEDRTS